MDNINLTFKDISEPKFVTIMLDGNTMNIIICDDDIAGQYSPELLHSYSLTPFEYFDKDCKKELNIPLDYTHIQNMCKKREHCSKVRIINITNDKLSVRYINNKFIVSKDIFPFDMKNTICRSSTDDDYGLKEIYNNKSIPSHLYILYNIGDSIIKYDINEEIY